MTSQLLSLWEAPSDIDIHLPTGFNWVLPVNGDKAYTRVRDGDGRTIRMSFDSPHLARHAASRAPPPTTTT